jgi:hypothetical protein
MSGTRWMWVPIDGMWALAFGYMDPSAGPSAKGAIVSNPPTFDEIRNAIDHPNRTFREPTAFGAVVIDTLDALKMGLPKDPPWIGFFEKDKAVPPSRGEPSRVVIAIVTQDGQPVANAEVKLGEAIGQAREVIPLHTLTSDENGRCVFPLAPRTGLVVVAHTQSAGSKQTDVVVERDFVEVPLVAFGVLEGVITKQGRSVAGSVSITGKNGGVHRVKRGDAAGSYRIEGVVPDTYDVRVEGIDPQTHMTAGTPTIDVVTIAPGAVVRRDFTLVAGVHIDFQLRVQHNSHNGTVYLLRGEHAPQTSVELYDLARQLGNTQCLSSNSSSNNGTYMKTRLSDVTPGVYTACVFPTDYEPNRHREQPVMRTRIVVANEPLAIEMELLPVRRSEPKPPPPPGPKADVRLPPPPPPPSPKPR